MKEIKQYIVDAFTDKVFSGNQAAVCLPDEVLSPELMQKIAVENNFSETAFAVNQMTDMICGGSLPAVRLTFAAMRPSPLHLS